MSNRAVGYARVSTEDQAKEGISLENQQWKIKAYCGLYNIELADMVVDAGQSAKDVNRDGMKRILAITGGRRPEVDCIVVYKLDRLFRNAEQALRYASLWDKKGIALHSVNEQLDTKSAMGKFFFTIMAAVAEMERNVVAERTADVLRGKKRRGEKTGGTIPYGFDVEIRQDVKCLIESPEEQAVVRTIKALRAKGMSLREIAEQLERSGIATKSGAAKWHPQTVKRAVFS